MEKYRTLNKKSFAALAVIGCLTLSTIPANAFAEQKMESENGIERINNNAPSVNEMLNVDKTQNENNPNKNDNNNSSVIQNAEYDTSGSVFTQQNNADEITSDYKISSEDFSEDTSVLDDKQHAERERAVGKTKGMITSTENGNAELFWSDSQAPQMYGTCEATIPVGDKFSVLDARFRVFARDFEDGDVTAAIESINGSSIDTSSPGVHYVTYRVTDTDGNTSEFVSRINVVADTHEVSLVKTAYQNASTWNLQKQGINRGDHHDRQILGIWIPAGQSATFEYINGGGTDQKLTLSLPTADSQTDGIGGDVSAGNTLAIKASDASGTIPTLKTPMNRQQDKALQHPIKYKVTYSIDSGIKPAHYWHYGDDETSFLASWRDDSDQPFSFIEGNSIAIIVPFDDRNRIFGNNAKDHFHKTLASWCAYWDKVMDKDDSMLGISIRANDPSDQRVRTKYFVRPNVHGAGGAYYASGDHVGVHSASDY